MTTRRRVLSIVAAGAGLAPLAALHAAVAPDLVSTWRGSAMGALASMTLVHPDRALARSAIGQCVAEIERLEAVLSLYRPDSALSRLNAHGELQAPPQALVELLSFALSLAHATQGAFDPTVQPLYRLYADHFARPGARASGPSRQAIVQVLRRVGYGDVDLRSEHIRLGRPGMALTLNGVAQGYLTDRVAELLLDAGFRDVLIDLGEARALGQRADGLPWRAGIADPREPTRVLRELPLGERGGALPALATSAGYGTRFGPDPRLHHLLDPHTGTSARHHASVTVAASRATLADGLSTALSIVAPARAEALLAAHPGTRAYVVEASGEVRQLPSA
ncbi:MAG: FAD:protein FMN transferase [Rhizobacter sp.]|nr:FAD:protein FMN transferase [Rhizobacter sp.]